MAIEFGTRTTRKATSTPKEDTIAKRNAERVEWARKLRESLVSKFGTRECSACYGTTVNIYAAFGADGKPGKADENGTVTFPVCPVCHGEGTIPDVPAEDLVMTLREMMTTHNRLPADGRTVRWGNVAFEPKPKARRTVAKAAPTIAEQLASMPADQLAALLNAAMEARKEK